VKVWGLQSPREPGLRCLATLERGPGGAVVPGVHKPAIPRNLGFPPEKAGLAKKSLPGVSSGVFHIKSGNKTSS